MNVSVASKCEIGLVREVNQDAIFFDYNEQVGIFAVADGMGGHSEGGVASQYMVQCVQYWWEHQDAFTIKNNRQDAARRLAEHLKKCSNELLDEFMERDVMGGTTVCILLLFGDTYTTLSAGDSRVYKLEAKEVVQITTDDVWENLPDVREMYSQSEIVKDPRYGKLTMAAGFDRDITMRVSQGILKKGDTFLVCTDGLYRFCDSQKLYKFLREKTFFSQQFPIVKVMKKIEEEVLANGARDNYSAIICRVE